MQVLHFDILSYCLEALVLCGLRGGWGPPAVLWALAWVLHAVSGILTVRVQGLPADLQQGMEGQRHVGVISAHGAVAPAALMAAAGSMGARPLARWLPCPAVVLYCLARLNKVS